MQIRSKLLAAALFSFGALGLGAAAAAPSNTAGQPAALSTASVVQRTLPNGLKVLVWPRHTAPVVTTMMWYHVGSRDEVPGETGLAHFLEHLLFKGTHKLAKGEIDRLTYQNGGSNNAFTFNDYTAFEFNFPKKNWTVALQIEADRMRNCVFDKKEFDAERQVVMEERRQGQDDPEQAFGEQLNTLLFQVHPYRNPVIGWMGDIRRVPRDSVYAFYQKFYVPANCTLVITGDVDPQQALAAAGSAFEAVPKLPMPLHRPIAEPAQIAERRMRVSLPTQVARVAVMFSGPARKSPDSAALEVLQYALAEGRLSRLYRRLVDGDQTAAAVDASVNTFRDAGEISFNANLKSNIEPEVVEAAIWQELERMQREPLTERELQRAKNQFYSDWLHGMQTANQLGTVLGEWDAVGSVDLLSTLATRVQAVSAQDVQRVAKEYLVRPHAVIGYLDPQRGAPASGSKEMSRADGAWPARRAGRTAPKPVVTVRTPATPVSAAPATFPTLHPVERRLPNGMHVILLESHELPTVTLTAQIHAGSFQETDRSAGLANLTARMLDEGTRTRNYNAIAVALEQVGASFSAAAGGETTTASLETLSTHTDELLPLYAELLRAPSFPEQRLEQERARVLVELKELEDDAGYVARRAFDRLVYGTHPAARPVEGTEATVQNLDRDNLQEFHARYYRPENVTLVAVGDFRAEALLARITDAFGDWRTGPAVAPESLPQPARQTAVRTERLTMDKTQAQIVLGHLGVRRKNPDYIALKVLDSILGEGVSGGFTARIPYQLRDIQGLAYTVGSSITSSAGLEPGTFSAAMGTDPAKVDVAIPALLKEIQKVRQTGVTDKELAEAKRYLTDSYVFGFQTHSQLANYLLATDYYGLGYNYRQEFPRLVNKVTRADVLRVARQYLDPEHYTLVVVGPERAGNGKGAAK